MNIVFTICSVNYLASAKCLAISIAKTNPGTKFIYIIADKINNKIPVDYFENIEFIEVEALNIPNLNELIATYNIVEFNTAIKPYAVKYLVKKFNASKLIFLDPDIIMFGSLNDAFEKLDKYDFILTPHILHPIIDEVYYTRQAVTLSTGVFNLGFIAINYNTNSEKIIEWWAHHMRNHGHSNSSIGEFYDQKIMNLLPIFSDKVLIEKNAGYNVAGWNIHEREITKQGTTFFANNSPLIFYHYSGFIHDRSTKLISSYSKLTTDSNNSISEILDEYTFGLKKNNHADLCQIKCYYNLKPNIHKSSRWQILKYKINKWLK